MRPCSVPLIRTVQLAWLTQQSPPASHYQAKEVRISTPLGPQSQLVLNESIVAQTNLPFYSQAWIPNSVFISNGMVGCSCPRRFSYIKR